MIYKVGDILTTKCNDWPDPCRHYGIICNYNNKLCVFNNTPSKTNRYGGNIVAQPLNEFLSERCILKVERSNIKSQDVIAYCMINRKRKWRIYYNCGKFIEDIKRLGPGPLGT